MFNASYTFAHKYNKNILFYSCKLCNKNIEIGNKCINCGRIDCCECYSARGDSLCCCKDKYPQYLGRVYVGFKFRNNSRVCEKNFYNRLTY
jgi:hypothetical protein